MACISIGSISRSAPFYSWPCWGGSRRWRTSRDGGMRGDAGRPNEQTLSRGRLLGVPFDALAREEALLLTIGPPHRGGASVPMGLFSWRPDGWKRPPGRRRQFRGSPPEPITGIAP